MSLYVMKHEHSVDIHNLHDIELMKFYMKGKKHG